MGKAHKLIRIPGGSRRRGYKYKKPQNDPKDSTCESLDSIWQNVSYVLDCAFSGQGSYEFNVSPELHEAEMLAERKQYW